MSDIIVQRLLTAPLRKPPNPRSPMPSIIIAADSEIMTELLFEEANANDETIIKNITSNDAIFEVFVKVFFMVSPPKFE
jgi:hypothetical protein